MTTRRHSLFIFAASLLLLLVQYAAAADWAGIRSGNLLIAGQAPEADLKEIARRLERFRSAMDILSPRLRTDETHPTNVLVFPDDAAFGSFGWRRESGGFDETVAGYFVRGEDANYIAISAKGRTMDPFHTIFHEYVHNLLRARGGAEVPAWLNEGLAQYLETAEFVAGRGIVLGIAPRGRAQLLQKSEMLPLKKLLASTNDEVHAGGASRPVFYAQAWLLVHYLLSKAPGPSFRDRLERVFEWSGDHAAIERLVKEKAPALETPGGLRSYLAGRPGTQAYETGPAGVSVSDPAPQPITPAAADALLGELLLRIGRRDDAEVLVRKALGADPRSLQANVSLGEILNARGSYSDARVLLETAERSGELGPAALFHLAYALMKETRDRDQRVGKLPPNIADRALNYLRRAIHLRPSFVEPYKLLGYISLINNDWLREGASSLATAAALRPADAELQILLARTYLRLEQYADASAIAAAITAGSGSAQIRKEAAEIQTASAEYRRANVNLTAGQTMSVAGDYIFLKRSWLTDRDLKQIELNRELTNLNGLLDRPRPGEVRLMGTIDKITCTGGSIGYTIASEGNNLKLWGSRFDNLRLAVLVQGMHSFRLDCGASFAGQKAVFLYKPVDERKRNSRAELTSVTFVPENFRLLNETDSTAARFVVVEDDMLRRGREREGVERYTRVSESERIESLKVSLRKPAPSEKQIVARLTVVECSNGATVLRANAAGRDWEFSAQSANDVAVRWYTPAALNFRLACDTQPQAENVLLTYKPGTVGSRDELTAIEFIPTDYSASSSIPR